MTLAGSRSRISRNNLGFALINTRQADAALAQFRKILERDPANVMARVNIGFTYLQRAEIDRAVAQFQAIVADHDDLAIAHYNLGLALNQKHLLHPTQLTLH